MPRRVACKARGYGACEVIVGEQVDDDQEARRDGEPWPRDGRDNDVDWLRRCCFTQTDVSDQVPAFEQKGVNF